MSAQSNCNTFRIFIPTTTCQSIKQSISMTIQEIANPEKFQDPDLPSKHAIVFTYKGIDYDASHYVDQHPGGREFILNMKDERKDITEYFKALHSERAEKILMSFKQVGKSQNHDSQFYFNLLSKVQHLYQPNWLKEAAFITLVAGVLLLACFTANPFLAVAGFAFSQAIAGWLAHSMNHSRHPKLHFLGNIVGALLGGMSAPWWGFKHNMHHMFTNSHKYDDDIKHEYFMPLYPFLYVKWRFDSLVSSLKTLNVLDLLCMGVNYYLISRQNCLYFLCGITIAGFLSANLLIGNHEREKRYGQSIKDDFIEHQLITCRNYDYNGIFWLTIMGGMQYQSEHHLFPQILFYNLPEARRIIHKELETIGKHVIVGPVLA